MDEYVEQLEETIKQMLKPLKKIPFKLVIESLSGYKIIPFNSSDKMDETLLQKLIEVARVSATKINQNGIKQKRANEVGNAVEPYVKDALNSINYTAGTPTTKNGNKKSTGYPDIEFKDEFNRTNYLECKTYNIQNIKTTQRSFYLSPSEDFKITKNAHHFIISFEIIEESRGNNFNTYKCKGWKILSIENLLVDVKHEFNSDNARMYKRDLLLAEEKIN